MNKMIHQKQNKEKLNKLKIKIIKVIIIIIIIIKIFIPPESEKLKETKQSSPIKIYEKKKYLFMEDGTRVGTAFSCMPDDTHESYEMASDNDSLKTNFL